MTTTVQDPSDHPAGRVGVARAVLDELYGADQEVTHPAVRLASAHGALLGVTVEIRTIADEVAATLDDLIVALRRLTEQAPGGVSA